MLKESLEKANQVTAASLCHGCECFRSFEEPPGAHPGSCRGGQAEAGAGRARRRRLCSRTAAALPLSPSPHLTHSQAKLEQEVERHRKAMGLQDGAQQLIQQQQQAITDAAKAKAALAAATERMVALVPAVGRDGLDVFEGVENEVRELRCRLQQLQQQAKRTSMQDKITARQQALELQQQGNSGAVASPAPASAVNPAPLSPSEAAAMASEAQVLVMLRLPASHTLHFAELLNPRRRRELHSPAALAQVTTTRSQSAATAATPPPPIDQVWATLALSVRSFYISPHSLRLCPLLCLP